MSTFMTTHPPKPEFGIRNSEFGISAHPGHISDFEFRISNFEFAAHPHGRRDACPTNPGMKPHESLWGRRPACQESGWVTSRCWRKA